MDILSITQDDFFPFSTCFCCQLLHLIAGKEQVCEKYGVWQVFILIIHICIIFNKFPYFLESQADIFHRFKKNKQKLRHNLYPGAAFL